MSFDDSGKIYNNSTSPTVNDGYSGGFVEGDKWRNTLTEETFELFDGTIGAAVWVSNSSVSSSKKYYQKNSSLDRSSQTTIGLINQEENTEVYSTLVLTPDTTDNYKISVDAFCSLDSNKEDILLSLNINGTGFSESIELVYVSSDIDGTAFVFNVVENNLIVGSTSTGAIKKDYVSLTGFFTLNQGVEYTIDLSFLPSKRNKEAAIHSSVISCEQKTIS